MKLSTNTIYHLSGDRVRATGECQLPANVARGKLPRPIFHVSFLHVPQLTARIETIRHKTIPDTISIYILFVCTIRVTLQFPHSGPFRVRSSSGHPVDSSGGEWWCDSDLWVNLCRFRGSMSLFGLMFCYV